MAARRLFLLLSLLAVSSAVRLTSDDLSPWANEFERAELSCLIDSVAAATPRIEWKKIAKATPPSYVYYDGKLAGDLRHRAVVMAPATLIILNASRYDAASYRCEVTAGDGQLAELTLTLAVRVRPAAPRCVVPAAVPIGKAAILSCGEDEGFPKPKLTWFKDGKLAANASAEGVLRFPAVAHGDAGLYFCRARNEAGFSECSPRAMEVYDVDVVGIAVGVLVVVAVLLGVAAGVCCAYRGGHCSFKFPAKGDGLDFVRTENEGDFRHKSSFVI